MGNFLQDLLELQEALVKAELAKKLIREVYDEILPDNEERRTIQYYLLRYTDKLVHIGQERIKNILDAGKVDYPPFYTHFLEGAAAKAAGFPKEICPYRSDNNILGWSNWLDGYEGKEYKDPSDH